MTAYEILCRVLHDAALDAYAACRALEDGDYLKKLGLTEADTSSVEGAYAIARELLVSASVSPSFREDNTQGYTARDLHLLNVSAAALAIAGMPIRVACERVEAGWYEGENTFQSLTARWICKPAARHLF